MNKKIDINDDSNIIGNVEADNDDEFETNKKNNKNDDFIDADLSLDKDDTVTSKKSLFSSDKDPSAKKNKTNSIAILALIAVFGLILLLLFSGNALWSGQNNDEQVLPGEFNPLFPADNTDNIPLRPTFQWEDSPGATTYSLWLSEGNDSFDESDLVVDNELWTTSYTPDFDLKPETNHFWRVIAYNQDGEMEAEIIFSFMTGRGKPGAFSLSYPFDGTYYLVPHMELRWEESYGAENYSLWISDNPEVFGDAELVVNRYSGSSYITTEVLPIKNTYYWRVAAHNSEGDTFSNEIFSIIREPEPIYLNLSQFLPIDADFDSLTAGPLGSTDGRIPLVSDDGSENLYFGIPGPWGARYSDLDGRKSSNWRGIYNESLMTEPGFLGYHEDDLAQEYPIQGIALHDIMNKTSSYMAPQDGFVINEIYFADLYQESIYAGTNLHVIYECELILDGHKLLYHLGHSGFVHNDIYIIIADKRSIDFSFVKSEAEAFFSDADNVGSDFLAHMGLLNITLNKGDKIGGHHIQGTLVATRDGIDYYALVKANPQTGIEGIPVGYSPCWAQIEFDLHAQVDRYVGVERSYFSWIPQHEQDSIQSLLNDYALAYDTCQIHTMNSKWNENRNWYWSSELQIYKEWHFNGYVESILSGNGLGMWGEYDGEWEGYLPKRPYNDDAFCIWPVYWGDALKALSVNNSMNFYNNSEVGIAPQDIKYIVMKFRAQEAEIYSFAYDRFGQVLWSEGAETSEGSMVMYWNPSYMDVGEYKYQSMSFLLLPKERSLIISWSDEYDTFQEAFDNIPKIPGVDDVDGGSYEGEWYTSAWSGPGIMRYHNLFMTSMHGANYYYHPLYNDTVISTLSIDNGDEILPFSNFVNTEGSKIPVIFMASMLCFMATCFGRKKVKNYKKM